ncbi:MAG: hypothetical protein WCG14_07725 [Chlamydiia bacterium]
MGAKEAGCSYAKTLEKGQGRIEKREVWVTSDLEWLEGMEGWDGLKSLICVRSTRHEKGKTSMERRLYISSLLACTGE